MQDLDRLVRTCLQSAAEASAELARRQAAVTRGRDELDRAESALADMRAAVSRTTAELAEARQRGGHRLATRRRVVRRARRAGRRAGGRPPGSGARRPRRDRRAPQGRAGPRPGQARPRPGPETRWPTPSRPSRRPPAPCSKRSTTRERALADWAARHAGLLPDDDWQRLTEALGGAITRFGEPDGPRARDRIQRRHRSRRAGHP